MQKARQSFSSSYQNSRRITTSNSMHDNQSKNQNKQNNKLSTNIYDGLLNTQTINADKNNPIISTRKQNAKKIRHIEAQKQKQIQKIQKEHEQQKKQIIEKYQQRLKEKDQYIKMLEDMLALSKNSEAAQDNMHHQSPVQALKEQKRYQSNNMNQIIEKIGYEIPIQVYVPNINRYETNKISKSVTKPIHQTIYLHQKPLLDDLCFSVQKFDKKEKLGRYNQTINFSRPQQNNEISTRDLRMSRKSVDFGRRAASASKHQLNPVPRPILRNQ